MAEDRLRPGPQHGGPAHGLPARLPGEGRVDAPLQGHPAATVKLPLDRGPVQTDFLRLPAGWNAALQVDQLAAALWDIRGHNARLARVTRSARGDFGGL